MSDGYFFLGRCHSFSFNLARHSIFKNLEIGADGAVGDEFPLPVARKFKKYEKTQPTDTKPLVKLGAGHFV